MIGLIVLFGFIAAAVIWARWGHWREPMPRVPYHTMEEER